MTVMVRNAQAGPTVFSDLSNDIQIVWEGKGDVAGGDVRAVPDSLLENAAFINAINVGTFVIEEDDKAAWDAIRAQTEAINAKRQAQREESLASIDRTSNRVIATADIDEKGNVTYTATEDDLIDIEID